MGTETYIEEVKLEIDGDRLRARSASRVETIRVGWSALQPSDLYGAIEDAVNAVAPEVLGYIDDPNTPDMVMLDESAREDIADAAERLAAEAAAR